jgi:cyanate permease
MLGNLCAAGIPPVQAYLMKDLGITLVQAGHVTTYTLLTLGLAVCICPELLRQSSNSRYARISMRFLSHALLANDIPSFCSW